MSNRNNWNLRTSLSEKPIAFYASSKFSCPYIIVCSEDNYIVTSIMKYDYRGKPLSFFGNGYRNLKEFTCLNKAKRHVNYLEKKGY